VLLQGTTLSFVAKLLHVSVPAGIKRKTILDIEDLDKVKSTMKEIVLSSDSTAIGKRIVDLGIPPTINILAIERSGVYVVPIGSTRLSENDKLYILAEDTHALHILSLLLGLSEYPKF